MNGAEEAWRAWYVDGAGARDAFLAGAAWARREALKEALAVVSTPSGNMLPMTAISDLLRGDRG